MTSPPVERRKEPFVGRDTRPATTRTMTLDCDLNIVRIGDPVRFQQEEMALGDFVPFMPTETFDDNRNGSGITQHTGVIINIVARGSAQVRVGDRVTWCRPAQMKRA